MTATITFFPVADGDMTLITLDNKQTILVDVNIRAVADDPDDPARDVVRDLKNRLQRDGNDRLYVDAFLLSHPDEDHCRGLEKHFHLGKPDECPKSKILIHELWLSPRVFRRASAVNPLCADAKAFNRETKRRAGRFRESGRSVAAGDRILMLGDDDTGNTDDLAEILINVDSALRRVNGQPEAGFCAHLLGPLPPVGDDDDVSKNDASVILNIELQAGGGSCRYLTGGDAGVAIWERVWSRHSIAPEALAYDLLLAPHHCSWHALSYDSWTDCGEQAKVSRGARNALGQALSGANIVASSKAISDNDSNPPHIRAKREYEAILKPVSGTFKCTGESPNSKNPAPMTFEIGSFGLSLMPTMTAAPAIVSSDATQGQPLPHG